MIDSSYYEIVTVAASALAAFLIGHKVVSGATIDESIAIASEAAHAAEELFANHQGQQKFDWAVQHVCDKLGISEAEAGMLVTAAVTGLRSKGIKPAKAA